ncbi:adoMet dependent proline di-methyltransferase domain-containing protein [Phthorimaea operculella]|nr:adoMet dependent proline di-methyltransferase domain-containing protein [Phthorimaea operculella]
MNKPEQSFYGNAKQYWSKIPATVDGVLGGFGYISDTDLQGSRDFINDILASKNPPNTKLAIDCGAGIGRITKNVLIKIFDKVDLVEQDEKFISAAVKAIGPNNEKLGTVYKTSLQSFYPDKKYDVIWIQWVLCHLKDDDMCKFLSRCRKALNPNGIIVVKENVNSELDVEYDEEDSSVTRPLELILKIFEVAKLIVIKSEVQKGFPDEIHPVHTFALIPRPELDLDD